LVERYDVVVCRECGFSFADGIPDQTVLDAYYRDASKYEHAERGGKQSEGDLVRLTALADSLAKKVPVDSAVLDVGCSTGTLLALLRDRGFRHLTGLDPSPMCAEIARREYDIEVWTGSLSAPPADGPVYDCLILAAVLEHVRDLVDFLANTKRWLKPGGYMSVTVPDASHFVATQNAPFQEFSVEHINFFGPISLHNLMGAHGFIVCQTEQVVREIGRDVTGTELIATYRDAGVQSPWIRDNESEPALRAYITRCQEAEVKEQKLFRQLAENRKPIIVWGVGTHAQRLLATTPLAKANIVLFVDSNPKYQGKYLAGCPVVAPQALQGRTEPILITSWTFFDEIQSQIRRDLALTNEIIRIHVLR
jgi:SAM-dependent methyltransferase